MKLRINKNLVCDSLFSSFHRLWVLISGPYCHGFAKVFSGIEDLNYVYFVDMFCSRYRNINYVKYKYGVKRSMMGTFEKLFFVCELKSRVAILVNVYFFFKCFISYYCKKSGFILVSQNCFRVCTISKFSFDVRNLENSYN